MDDSTIRLTLELGFQHDHNLTNSSELEKKKKKNDHQQQRHNTFSFLSLALSEPQPQPRSDDDDVDHPTAVRDDIIKELNKGKTVVAAASSLTAVSSWAAAMSDDDEDCNTPKKKLRLSKHQISILENTFELHPTLNPKDKNDLASQLNLRPRQVEVWFQNRRARIKMKQTEVDRESLKKCCEILREENRRLQKEVTELKSMKLQAAIPFQFQLNIPSSSSSSPAAPTTCPSCEGTGRTRSSSLNPNNNINGDADSPTRSFFSSSTDSNNTPKTRICKN